MSIAHKVAALLAKAWADALRAESERWILTCKVCGTQRSVWDSGGVRYKGDSRGKVVGVYCATCRALRFKTME